MNAMTLLEKLMANSAAQDTKDNIYAALCRIAQY